jgi:hypothetical protein
VDNETMPENDAEGHETDMNKEDPLGECVFPNTRPRFELDPSHMDDVFVLDLEDLPVGRPWMALLIDVNTRHIVGYQLFLKSESETKGGAHGG